jgi:hypothetical protein
MRAAAELVLKHLMYLLVAMVGEVLVTMLEMLWVLLRMGQQTPAAEQEDSV